ncbi:zinc finger CCCH domain-containing protein 3 isoform X2 [Petromyzon marinus]|uniref:zinc finger CCCH domain-containing protein 3 isoform X2 n=1 Tax=Petromyzon marinus TaxID=7757 RepID=UPI003F6EF336
MSTGEKESLQRQIRFLTGLINAHRSQHGDAPRRPADHLSGRGQADPSSCTWTNPARAALARAGLVHGAATPPAAASVPPAPDRPKRPAASARLAPATAVPPLDVTLARRSPAAPSVCRAPRKPAICAEGRSRYSWRRPPPVRAAPVGAKPGEQAPATSADVPKGSAPGPAPAPAVAARGRGGDKKRSSEARPQQQQQQQQQEQQQQLQEQQQLQQQLQRQAKMVRSSTPLSARSKAATTKYVWTGATARHGGPLAATPASCVSPGWGLSPVTWSRRTDAESTEVGSATSSAGAAVAAAITAAAVTAAARPQKGRLPRLTAAPKAASPAAMRAGTSRYKWKSSGGDGGGNPCGTVRTPPPSASAACPGAAILAPARNRTKFVRRRSVLYATTATPRVTGKVALRTRYKLVRQPWGPASPRTPRSGPHARGDFMTRRMSVIKSRPQADLTLAHSSADVWWGRRCLRLIGGVAYSVTAQRLARAGHARPPSQQQQQQHRGHGAASSPARTPSPARSRAKGGKTLHVYVNQGGVRYSASHSGKKLRRLHSPRLGANTMFSARSPASLSPGSFSFSASSTGSSRVLPSRAVQRSVQLIRRARLWRRLERPRDYCTFYNRFGRCNRGDACTFLHDPDKVAVCTRFLRGTCRKTDGTCQFSHKVSREKMPVCCYYLRGVCSSADCPYSHVKVSRKAEACADFLKGYCPLAEKCKKLHTLECPEFRRTGSCQRGQRCRLLHRAAGTSRTTAGPTAAKVAAGQLRGTRGAERPGRSARTTESAALQRRTAATTADAAAAGIVTSDDGGDDAARGKPRQLPSFIALGGEPAEASATVSPRRAGASLHIRPRLPEVNPAAKARKS